MAQLFKPHANTWMLVGLFGLLATAIAVPAVLDILHRSSYATDVNFERKQEVPFSHKHHLALGLDCRYCHTAVARPRPA